MRIKNIRLKNGYKRFHDLTIDLGPEPKRIVALVGANGCGKSSVFDGMLFLQSELLRGIGDQGGRDSKFHFMHQNGKSSSKDDITIDFVEGDFYSVIDRKVSASKQRTIFSFRSSYRYNSDLKVKDTKAISEISANNYGASTSIDIDDRMEQSYRRLQTKFYNHLKNTDCKFSEARAKIMGDLDSALSNCVNLRIVDLGDITKNQGTLYFTKKDQQTPFEFNVLSSGEKEVVDILLDLYLRREVYDESIYMIDQPELHINTAVQRKLLMEINKMIPADSQIWIATHSIGLLRALKEELDEQSQVIEFRDEVNWASESHTLTPIEKNRTDWRRIFAVAIDDLSNLVSPRIIIHCEEKNKPGGGSENGIDAAMYNNIFSKKYPHALFVSGGDGSDIEQRSEMALGILSRVLNDIEVLVLKDMRVKSGGATSAESHRRTYLENSEKNHRMLKRREIENYLFDKEVLKKYCDHHNLLFNTGKYDNFVTDVNTNNLKDEIGKIKSICSIDVRIDHKDLKTDLSMFITEDMEVYSELEEAVFSPTGFKA